MMSPDLWLLRLINGLAGQWTFLDRTMQLLVTEFFTPVALALLLLVMWFGGRDFRQRRSSQRVVLQAMLATYLANAIVKISNFIYFRPRPFLDHEVNLLFYRPSDSSFPSNPAALAFAIASAVWLHDRRSGGVTYVLATLFAFARVFSGVHYPLDVVAGAAIGAFSAYLTVRKMGFLNPIFEEIIRLGRAVHLA